MDLKKIKVGDSVRISSIRGVYDSDPWRTVLKANKRYIVIEAIGSSRMTTFARFNGEGVALTSQRISGHRAKSQNDDQSRPEVDVEITPMEPTSKPGPKPGDKIMCPDGIVREWSGEVLPDKRCIRGQEK